MQCLCQALTTRRDSSPKCPLPLPIAAARATFVPQEGNDANALATCQHVGTFWLLRVTPPEAGPLANLRVWYPLRSAVDDASFLEWRGIVNVLAHADPRQAVSSVARIGVAQCKDTWRH